MIAGMVDVRGIYNGILDRYGQSVDVGERYGVMTGLAKFTGASNIAEAYVNIDIMTGEPIGDGYLRAGHAATGLSEYLGTATTVVGGGQTIIRGAASPGARQIVSRLWKETDGSIRISFDIVEATNSGLAKFDVGPYNQMKGKVPGLDAHHAGQSAAMKKVVAGYAPDTAPTILVPSIGHTRKGPHGIVSRSTQSLDSARNILARDIRELRRVYPDVPNAKLKELIDMNKKLYPEMTK